MNRKIEIKQINQNIEESTAYSLFLYAFRSSVTKDCYLRRMKIYFDYINLLPNGNLEEKCNLFAVKGLEDPKWAFNNIIKFLQYQKERVEKTEIAGGTLRNFVKTIKLFCEMSEIPIHWKKITRGLPKSRKYADDRAPTLEELQRICEYPDRRIKAIVYTMASSGIRLGAWDYLQLKHIIPIEREGKIVAAKIIVYGGDNEEYFSFITPEAYVEIEKWIEYRKNCGENIKENSWVMRQLWDTKKGYYHHGTIKNPEKLKSSGIKRLIEDALWTQGIRKKSNLKKKRYEFQTDHGMRKWFKTQCEMSGMKSINIEVLMGHSIGISDSYYKITEDEFYSNSFFGLSIKHPKNWIAVGYDRYEQNGMEIIADLCPKEFAKSLSFSNRYSCSSSDYLISFFIYYNVKKSLEEFANQRINAIIKETSTNGSLLSDLAIIKPETDILLNEEPAKTITYTYKGSNDIYKRQEIFLLKDGVGYSITYQSPELLFDNYLDTANKIIGTLNILPLPSLR